MGVNNSMDVLASLQALAAKKNNASGSSTAAKEGQASFADVWKSTR